MMLKITADEDTISEFFVILLRELGIPPKIQIDISQNEEKRHTAYAVISVESENELKRKQEEIKKILGSIPGVSWEIINYKKYGSYYVITTFFDFTIETAEEPIVMKSLMRYIRTLKKMQKYMGKTAYNVMFALGEESGYWIADKYGESLRSSLENGNIKGVIEFILTVLAFVKNIPRSDVTTTDDTILIELKKEEPYIEILPLLITYVYGLLFGVLRDLGYECTTKMDVKSGKILFIKTKIGSKTWKITLTASLWSPASYI
ncbi:MAG: hypothetical protein DRN30_01305 [Thermoplasmata archaeon]|nr:MAG: hypothetical protein DRN30_01305 [Thermoplasmata archaeon]